MRKKAGDKRTAILRAAVETFASEGFAEAKVSTIAKKAGVATGSVYNYFENKDDLLHIVFKNLWANILARLTEISDSREISAFDKLEQMFDTVFILFAEDENLAKVFVNEHSFWMHRWDGGLKQLFDKFMLHFEHNLNEIGLRPGFDAGILRYMIFGAVRQLIHQWADENCRFSRDDARRQTNLLLRSLSSDDAKTPSMASFKAV
jgi:TetR/AcrR family transcriptional regulator, fatty acid metabolism regulator protein